MSADLRRSFKQKAKQAFELPSRLRKGLTDHLDGPDDDNRPMSFDFGCLLHDDNNRIFALQGTPPNKESDSIPKTRQRIPLQPKGTFKYRVMGKDTLRSLAAHHGTTSSELKTINRLHAETIFEGQTLYIPDECYSSCQDEEQSEEVSETSSCSLPPILIETTTTTVILPEVESKQVEVELLSYKPLQRLIYGGQDLFFTGIKPILSVTKQIAAENPLRISSSEDTSEDSIPFIKVPAKQIKDKNKLSNFVSGLLLLSSEFIMFDPDPCDVQAKEGDIEELSTIIPIVNLGSITLMKNVDSITSDRNQIIIKETGEKLANQLERIVCGENYSQLKIDDHHVTSDERKEPQVIEVFEKVFESSNETSKVDENPGMEFHETNVNTTPKKRSSSETSDEERKGKMENDKDPEVLAAALDQKIFEKKRSASMRKERPLSIVGNLFRFGGLESVSSSEVNSPTIGGLKKASLVGGGSNSVENIPMNTSKSPGGSSRLVTRTLSSLSSYSSSIIDDVSSHLFPSTLSIPKLQAISASPLSPTASPSLSDHQNERVFFLKPIDVLTKKVKEQLSSSVESAGDDEEKNGDLFLQFKTAPVIQAGSSDLKNDYLFVIQHDKTGLLFTFFLYWAPNSDEVPSCFDEPWFVLADRCSEVVVFNNHEQQDFSSKNSEEIEQKKKAKEWKIVNLREVKRLLRISEIEKLPLPELMNESHIMDQGMLKQLTFHLPPRAEGCKWSLAYSTEVHGFSLKTLFRRVERIDGPIVLIVKDDKNQVFGAMLSCTVRPSDTFYGNGECYLFSFHHKFKKFGWSGLNNYFLYTPSESISIGSGEGAVGLWLDGNLYYGRTQRCLTFNNDLLSEHEDFIIRCLEVWKFV